MTYFEATFIQETKMSALDVLTHFGGESSSDV